MPIWLRNYTYQEIRKFYDEERKAHEKTSSGDGVQTLQKSPEKIKVPDYIAKAHK